MSVIGTTAIVYGLIATNTYDRQKFQAGSQPYVPSRVVSCPLNDYGRPQGCTVQSRGVPVTVKQSYRVPTVPQSDAFDRVNPTAQ